MTNCYRRYNLLQVWGDYFQGNYLKELGFGRSLSLYQLEIELLEHGENQGVVRGDSFEK